MYTPYKKKKISIFIQDVLWKKMIKTAYMFASRYFKRPTSKTVRKKVLAY